MRVPFTEIATDDLREVSGGISPLDRVIDANEHHLDALYMLRMNPADAYLQQREAAAKSAATTAWKRASSFLKKPEP